MRSNSKFYGDSVTRFWAIANNLMRGVFRPPPRPPPVNGGLFTRYVGTYVCPLEFQSTTRAKTAQLPGARATGNYWSTKWIWCVILTVFGTIQDNGNFLKMLYLLLSVFLHKSSQHRRTKYKSLRSNRWARKYSKVFWFFKRKQTTWQMAMKVLGYKNMI